MFSKSKAVREPAASLHQKNVEKLVEKLDWADAICVGGASGMSAAAGYIWYTDDALFRRYFGSFAEKYGIDSIFNGFYYRYRTPEERWTYIATLIHYVRDCPGASLIRICTHCWRGRTILPPPQTRTSSSCRHSART